MVDPAWALLTAAAVAVGLYVLLRPSRGLLWQAQRTLLSSERVEIEDALKHLHDFEYHRRTASLQSLAGALGLSGERAAALLARLEAAKLAASSEQHYKLTPQGRSEALRVIRFHRLWERHLAESTGLDPTEWHAEADYREHALSEKEANALAARLGEPRFDPHGDPIPTAAGDIPPLRGLPLTDLQVGDVAEIVHVEDEPEALYAQLAALDLMPGLHLRLVEASPRRLVVEIDAHEHVLAPVVAAQVSVLPLAAGEADETGEVHLSLSHLEPGDEGEVVGLSRRCRGPERRRLLDLGIVPGTRVMPEMRSPSGDPTAYRVRGALIALRRHQADLVHVQRRAAGGKT